MLEHEAGERGPLLIPAKIKIKSAKTLDVGGGDLI